MTSSKKTCKNLSRTFMPKTHVDLSKLRKSSLKRYTKRYNLNVKSDNKQELLQAVTAHFVSMPVHELDVAREFHNYTMLTKGKRNSLETGPNQTEKASAR